MLSRSDRENISRFLELKPIHKRVLRLRLKKKSRRAVAGLLELSFNCHNLGIKVDDVISPEALKMLAQVYASQKELQIMYTQ